MKSDSLSVSIETVQTTKPAERRNDIQQFLVGTEKSKVDVWVLATI